MSYTPCPRCGQKALSVATQCPHCGNPFGTRPLPEPGPRLGRKPVLLVLAALGSLFFAIDALRHQTAADPPDPLPPADGIVQTPTPSPRPQTPAVTLARTPDSTPAAKGTTASTPSPAPQPPDRAKPAPPDPVADPPVRPVEKEVAPAEARSLGAGVRSSEAEAPSLDARPQERRYTTIWANVREAREPMARVVLVLHPGEQVLVDSLRQEWYRVVSDGQKVGYVYRALVDTIPPTVRN